MKSKFVESYDKLSDLKIGEVAVSADRENLFVRGYVGVKNEDGTLDTAEAIIDLNDVYQQYWKNRINWNIKKLVLGDKFILEV